MVSDQQITFSNPALFYTYMEMILAQIRFECEGSRLPHTTLVV